MSLPILKKSGIYSFKNKENGKVYVGQSKDVQSRKRQHERGDTNNSRRFHNAMVKHGADGFIFEVLEYCEDELLNERESYWIEKLQSIYPHGYNLTSGGGAFQKHNEETKQIFSQNQKKRVVEQTHIFTNPDFQEKQRLHQIELGKKGLLPSQSEEFQLKRNATVQNKIQTDGKFFTHTTEEIERKRNEQISLYSKGLGKFQQSDFIEKNRQLVKEKIANGEHHTQQDGWTEKSIHAHQHEMKPITLCIRTNDGMTVTKSFSSINDAVRKLDASKKRISELCNQKENVLTTLCNEGIIFKGCFGLHQTWTQEEVESISDSSLTKKMMVEITIQTDDGNLVVQRHESQRSACRELDANHRAVRFMLKGEKYKSTKCNLGRIIGVREIESTE